MPINNQFEHGRIPIKPLSYANKDIAQCNELLIDYGEDANYHIYMASSNDPTVLVDLTNIIASEVSTGSDIDISRLKINVDGIEDPIALEDIIYIIYKKFIYADNINGFIYDRDIDKVTDSTTKSVLLRDADGTMVLPVTNLENIIDDTGRTIGERLNNITKIGFSVEHLTASANGQSQFNIHYPYQNYSDFVQITVDGKYITNTDYYILNNIDVDDNYNTASLKFTNTSYISNGSKIDVLYMYNSAIENTSKPCSVSGSVISNYSIPLCKLEKVSSSYSLNDPNSIATSAGLNNLYNDITTFITRNSNNSIWGIDDSSLDNVISITTDKDFNNENPPFIVNGIVSCNKRSSTTLSITYSNGNTTYSKTMNIKYLDGTLLSRGIPANKAISFLAYPNNNIAYIITSGLNGLKTTRYIYKCSDQETEISYSNLNYSVGDIITVYRNGAKLFEDLDYFIDTINEKITLFIRTEEFETIIFEAINTY